MTKEKGQAKEVVNVRGMSDDEFIEKYGRLVHHCVWKRYAKKKARLIVMQAIQLSALCILKFS